MAQTNSIDRRLARLQAKTDQERTERDSRLAPFTGLQTAILVAGSASALAKKLNVTRQAVSQWKRIPASRLADAEKALGLPREVLMDGDLA